MIYYVVMPWNTHVAVLSLLLPFPFITLILCEMRNPPRDSTTFFPVLPRLLQFPVMKLVIGL